MCFLKSRVKEQLLARLWARFTARVMRHSPINLKRVTFIYIKW